MNVSRIAAAGLLAAGAYVLWRRSRGSEAAGGAEYGESWVVGDAFGNAADVVAETIGTYTGVDLGSSRFEKAVAAPENARIVALLTAAESKYGIPAGLLVRQAWQESRFNPLAVSPAGAKGLMQFMPATAAEWGVSVFDPESSADGAGRYMQWLYGRVGSWPLALAAYNWGVGNVLRNGMSAAPAETRNYVAEIGGFLGLV